MSGAPRGLAVVGVLKGVASPGIPGDIKRWVSAAAAVKAILRHSSSAKKTTDYWIKIPIRFACYQSATTQNNI